MKLNGKPIDKLLVADLKEELAKRDLPKHGKKQDLVQRLTNHLQQNHHEGNSEEPIKRNLITGLRCPEKGCDVVIIGSDDGEFEDMMAVHKHKQHWNIGCLPNEIILKIFSYVYPECRRSRVHCNDCFQQSEIIKLARVSKRFYELTKSPVLYRELKVDYALCWKALSDKRNKCPKPPMSLVKEVMSRGAQLRRVLSDNVEVIDHAFSNHGSSVKEISTTNLAPVLEHASKMKFNPKALLKLNFKLVAKQSNYYYGSGSFILIPENQDSDSYLSRIGELRVEFLGILKGDHHKIKFAAKFIALSMDSFASQRKVTVKFERFPLNGMDVEEVIRCFKGELFPILQCNLHSEMKDDDSWSADITRTRKRKISQENSPQDTKESFNNFLGHIRNLDQL